MGKCIYCGKDTPLYYREKPVCIACSESRIDRKPADHPADPPKPPREAGHVAGHVARLVKDAKRGA
jgi:hypothetical protein